MPVENYLEDFEVGKAYSHHWGRTFTQSDGILFATTTCQANPAYVNVEYARHLGYRDTPVPAALVLATVLGLSVEDNSEGGGPFLGMEDIRFHRPVYPGDTLYSESEVLEARPTRSRPGWGVVTWRTVGRNQDGEVVVELRRSNLVKIREPRPTD